jgi:hypothetical protein
MSKKSLFLAVVASIWGGTLSGPEVARAAQPTPDTPVQNVGLDAELIFRETIHALPKQLTYSFRPSGEYASGPTVGCHLSFRSSPIDRSIEAGTRFYSIGYKVEPDDKLIRVTIRLDQYKQDLALNCDVLKSETKKHITLRDVNEALRGVAELVPAPPLAFDYQEQMEEQTNLKKHVWRGEGFNGNLYREQPYTGNITYMTYTESQFSNLFEQPFEELLSAVTQNSMNSTWSVEFRSSIEVFGRSYSNISFRKLEASYKVLTPKDEFRGNFEERVRYRDLTFHFGSVIEGQPKHMVETYLNSILEHLGTFGNVKMVRWVNLKKNGQNTSASVELITTDWLPKRNVLK